MAKPLPLPVWDRQRGTLLEEWMDDHQPLYNTLTDNMTLSRNVGSISFFPSYTIHEVLPVTRGTRSR